MIGKMRGKVRESEDPSVRPL